MASNRVERERKLVDGLERAMAEAIYDRLGCHITVADQLWLLEDDTFAWWPPVWASAVIWLLDDDTFAWWPPVWASAVKGIVLSVCTQEDIKDLLGPGWDDGLRTDRNGEPIVTQEDANRIASEWASNNAYDVARDILDVLEEKQREDEAWARYKAELEAKQAAARAAYEEAEEALRDMHKDADDQH